VGRDGQDVCLICPSDKAKYFLFWGLTRFWKIRSDLLDGQNRINLRANSSGCDFESQRFLPFERQPFLVEITERGETALYSSSKKQMI
jgi:hypothetical protein